MRRNEDDRINIPLSKILILGFLIFLALHFFEKNKNAIETVEDEKDTVKTVTVKKQSNVRISKMSLDDVTKTLAQNPPKLNSDRDTVAWNRGEIIRFFSIDTSLQKRTATLVRRSNPKYGAAVALNPKTGQVLAMVSYNDPELPKLAENVALSNKFPSASIFKTVTAAAAFEYTDISCSTQLRFVGDNTTLYRRQFLPGEFGENANSISFADAYARSNNPVFGWLALHRVGRNNLLKSALKFGYNAKIPFEMPTDISYFPEATVGGLSTTNDSIHIAELGSGFNSETTLTPLLGALTAAAVINGGTMMVPTLVDSITDLSGKLLYSAKARKWRVVCTGDIADSLNLVMQETTKSGSARNSFAAMRDFSRKRNGSSITYGGKTGTKDSHLGRNELFVGFTETTFTAEETETADGKENDFSIATSVCFVQRPMFIMRPSQVSADIMLDYVRRKIRTVKDEQ